MIRLHMNPNWGLILRCLPRFLVSGRIPCPVKCPIIFNLGLHPIRWLLQGFLASLDCLKLFTQKGLVLPE